jgi:hypothetical protein
MNGRGRECERVRERSDGGGANASGIDGSNKGFDDDIDRSWLAGRRDLLPLDTEGW